MTKQYNIDFDHSFRQVVLKLANTYEPTFQLDSDHFETSDDFINDFSIKLCSDFSEQLRPLVTQAIKKELDQQSK